MEGGGSSHEVLKRKRNKKQETIDLVTIENHPINKSAQQHIESQVTMTDSSNTRSIINLAMIHIKKEVIIQNAKRFSDENHGV